MLGDVLVDARRDELLHGELDLALAGIDGQHLRLNHLSFAQDFGGVIQPAVSDNLADVDHALNALGDLHEGAEGHELGDWAGNLRTDGELRGHFGPGVGEGLLEAERDAALLRMNVENHGVNALTGLEDVGCDANFLAPGHLGDMDEALDSGLNLNEGAEVGNARDHAADALAGGEARRDGLPWFGLKLLEAERNLLRRRDRF